MNERVIEILFYLISELQTSKEDEQNIEVLSQDLLTQGYSPKEINFALAFLFQRRDGFAEESSFRSEPDQTYFRLLHPNEKSLLTTEAHGLLIQLRQSSLITDAQIEIILERVMISGMHPIGREELKNIIAYVLFDYDNYANDGYIYLDNSNSVH